MSLEGQRLGAALMEANIVRPNMELRGLVFGDSAEEIAQKANAEAFAFFGDVGNYDLDVTVELNLLNLNKPKKADPLPKYQGGYYARLR